MATATHGMSPATQDIAIIGMSCLYSGAPNLGAFWENILAGVDAIGEPPEGCIGDGIFDPEADANDRLYTVKGGYVGDLIEFDPVKFGVIPRSVDGGEPEHFVALQLAHDALEDAGYLDRTFDKERTEIILGRGTYANRGFVTVLQHTFALDQLIRILSQLHPEHSPEDLATLKAKLKESLPPFNAETAASLPHSVMCGRIANRLDLMGPAYSVDAACASALIAADLGMKDLSSGACDLALVGSVQISTTYPIALLFSQLGALSRSGKLRPFHSEADGTLLGEGAGVLVLKRLSDAEADGDRVYAVLKGIGTSSDGRAMGLLAPRLEGEELAMRRAYANSEISPDSIGLVEAHGTATPVGDETELTALRHIFGNVADGQARRPLGAVKSMIGHCIPAAGAAGLIKTALAVYHGVIPPTLHAESPHPALAKTPFYLPTEPRPWIHGSDHPRRAAVSAFGFGGINGHAVLEEHVPPGDTRATGGHRRNVHAQWDSEVILISGGEAAEIRDRCQGVLRYLANNPKTLIRDLAYSLNTQSPVGQSGCLAVVATDLADLTKKLQFAATKLADSAVQRIRERSGVYYSPGHLSGSGKLAFLFPGEGSQYPGMLTDICIHFSEARDWFDLMDRAFQDHERGILPSHSIFPIPGSSASEQERLWQMDGAIESVFAANQAMQSVLSSVGLRPDAIVGHSTGEYSALLASGAAQVENDHHLVDHILEGNRATERAQVAGLVPDGVLLAVGPADPDLIGQLAKGGSDDVYLAMDNCPHQAVLWGPTEKVEKVEAQLREKGAVCQKLPFSRAYHTPLFRAVSDELRGFYANATFDTPRIPLYSCVTAAQVPEDPEEIRRLALEHWARPVRFRETIEGMYADGVRTFVEVGPAANLTAFVTDILRQKDHLAVSSNTRRRSGIQQLNHLIGMLSAHGVETNLDSLYERRNACSLDPEEIFAGRESSKTVANMLRLSLALPEMELSPDTVPMTVQMAPIQAPAAPTSPPATEPISVAPASSARSRVMSEYMSVMEQFLETQERVLSSVLHQPPPTSESTHLDAWPLAGSRIQTSPNGGVSVHRQLSLDGEAFLRDHTLGGTVSEDPGLRALSVFPLAMSLEMMAQTALLVRPQGRPDEIRALKVHRWMPFDKPEVDIEIVAEPASSTAEIHVQLFVLSADGAQPVRRLTVSGTVLIHDSSTMPAGAPDFTLANARPSRWMPDQLYSEGLSHGMFHGTSLRSVASLDRVGDDGIEGTLAPSSTETLVSGPGRFGNLVSPLLIDAVSQLVGYWTAETLKRDFVVFPMGFDRLRIFSRPGEGQIRAAGRARCREIDDQRVRAELEVVGEGGELLIDISGWEVTRAALPEEVYAFRLAPREVFMSRPLPEKLMLPLGATGCRLQLPDNFLAMEEGIWLNSLAHLALGANERQRFMRLNGDALERRTWFLRQMAAKDAIRLFLNKRRGVDAYPADIEIFPEEEPLGARKGWPLHAVAQNLGTTLAVASEAGPLKGLGIDFELAGAPRDDTALSASEERHLQDFPDSDRQDWEQRLGCAKRAAVQALERAGQDASGVLEVHQIDSESEIVRLAVGGATLEVPTTRDEDLVIAIASWEGKQ